MTVPGFEPEKLLFQGAESKLYVGLYKGERAVLKERYARKYRIEELDIRLRKLRTRCEAKCLAKANKFGIAVPHVLFVDEKNGNLIMTMINGIPLSEVIFRDEHNLYVISCDVGNSIYRLHQEAKIIHGDLTSSNIMIVNNKSVLLDFGLASLKTSDESEAVDLYCFSKALESYHESGGKQIFSYVLEGYTANGTRAKEVIDQYSRVSRRGRKLTDGVVISEE